MEIRGTPRRRDPEKQLKLSSALESIYFRSRSEVYLIIPEQH